MCLVLPDGLAEPVAEGGGSQTHGGRLRGVAYRLPTQQTAHPGAERHLYDDPLPHHTRGASEHVEAPVAGWAQPAFGQRKE